MKHTYLCLTAFIMTKPWLKQSMLPSHIVIECQKWRCSNHLKTSANVPSLKGIVMSLVQMKDTYPCLTAFIATEPWLKQPKMLPSHIVVECQKWICSNHHSTFADKPSLAGVVFRLVKIKHTYPSLHAFTMTEHWLKQQKMLPSHVAVECQKLKVH